MVAEDHFLIGGDALPIADSTGTFPWSCLRINPSKVALSEFEDPGMIKALELLGHVICNMPNRTTMLIIDLAIVPNLFGMKERETKINK